MGVPPDDTLYDWGLKNLILFAYAVVVYVLKNQ